MTKDTTKYVLSIDGGGIRGIAPARMLAELDKALIAAGKKPVVDAFDLFVGTSTGSIVAAALAASVKGSGVDYTDPEAIVAIYRRRGLKIFPKSPLQTLRNLLRQKYSAEPLKEVLHEALGDLTLGQLPRNFMATFYSMRPDTPKAVFAHGGPDYGPGSGDEEYNGLLLREVVQASSAAPTFFNPATVARTDGKEPYVGIDGGVYANNPAMSAYVEARKKFPGDPIIVVSLGCGSAKTQYDKSVKTWGILEWVSVSKGVPLLKAVMHGQADSVIHQMKRVLKNDFFRFSFELDEVSARMDDASAENLDRLEEAARQALKDNRVLLGQLVALMPSAASAPTSTPTSGPTPGATPGPAAAPQAVG